MLGEPGGDMLVTETGPYRLWTVNLAEIITKVDDRGLSMEDAHQVLRSLGIEHVAFDFEDAVRSSGLRAATRHVGLSLGDRACLALALSLEASVLTADRVWATLDVGVEIGLIR